MPLIITIARISFQEFLTVSTLSSKLSLFGEKGIILEINPRDMLLFEKKKKKKKLILSVAVHPLPISLYNHTGNIILFLTNVPILYPLKKKNQKSFGFLVFSVGIKREHWPEMD